MSIIITSDMLPQDMLAPLITDCQQLQRVLIAGIKYAANPANCQTAAIDYPTKGVPS